MTKVLKLFSIFFFDVVTIIDVHLKKGTCSYVGLGSEDFCGGVKGAN
jgi:hypothetical protein